jgi:proteasome alpha subunit
MSMPFYVAPEQFMKDKADYARKNISRGRPLVATAYSDGILLCAENPSQSLHKVSEIPGEPVRPTHGERVHA